jgi:hypothetical protein
MIIDSEVSRLTEREQRNRLILTENLREGKGNCYGGLIAGVGQEVSVLFG